MDPETLYRIADTIVSAVLAQDTTEYFEKIHSQCEMVEALNDLPGTGTGSSSSRRAPSTISCGPTEISFRTRALFKWLQQGHLCQPASAIDLVRVARKRHGEARESEARDIRSCSSVTVVWGRSQFMLQDKCYIHDDGLIGAIDRTIVPPQAPEDPQYIAERNSFYSEGKSRINPSQVKPPILDFSFCDLTDVIDALRTAPRSGKKFKRATVYVPKAEKQDEQRSATFNPNAEDGDKRNVLIRARNRRGEEEAYEFHADVGSVGEAGGGKGKNPTDTGNEGPVTGAELVMSLGKSLPCKYTTDTVRLSSNTIETIHHIIPVLRNLCIDSILTIQWLDLSCNRITEVPDTLGTLSQLTTLYLHSNNISQWDQVQTVRRTCSKLHTLTLYGNPIATKNTDYKQIVLSIMMRLPEGHAPLKSLDFVVLSGQDKHVTAMYEQFHPTPEKKRESQRVMRERTMRLQQTFSDY